MLDFPQPADAKQLKLYITRMCLLQFLQIIESANNAIISSSYSLLHDKSNNLWGKQHENAFENIKEAPSYPGSRSAV